MGYSSMQQLCLGAPIGSRCLPASLAKRSGSYSRSLLHRLGTRATRDSSGGNSSRLILLECDGVMVDLHAQGHRVAFNKAFSELGLECANWSTRIYEDLRRSGNGTAEGMLTSFFQMVGWPMAVATSDQQDFVASVHKLKQKMLKNLLLEGAVPLRDGVSVFLDEALESGASVGAICGTLSTSKDDVWSCVVGQLDSDVADKIVPLLFDDQTLRGGNVKSLQHHVRSGIAEMKKKEARAFVDTVMHRKDEGIGMGIDPHLLAGKTSGISAEWVSAVVTLLSGTPENCAVIAGNTSTMKAGAGAGALTIAVPVGESCRGSFPEAKATFESIGRGGGLSWNRVEALLQSTGTG